MGLTKNHQNEVHPTDTNSERDTWEEVAPRAALSLAVLDNKLYAMGGYDGTAFLDIVEIYDPATNSWKSGTPLTSVRSGHASAVCYQHVSPPEPDAPALVAKLPRRAPSAGPPAAPAGSGADHVPMANNILSSLSTSHRRL